MENLGLSVWNLKETISRNKKHFVEEPFQTKLSLHPPTCQTSGN